MVAWYLTNLDLTDEPAPAFTLATGTGWGWTSLARRVKMTRTQLYGTLSRPIYSQDSSALAVEYGLAAQAISPPLKAQTLGGTLTVTATHHGNTAATVRGAARAFVCNEDGTVLRGMLKAMQQADAQLGVGIGTWPFTITFGTLPSLAVQAGDRIVLECGMVNNSVGSAAIWPVYWNDDNVGSQTTYGAVRGTFTFSQEFTFYADGERQSGSSDRTLVPVSWSTRYAPQRSVYGALRISSASEPATSAADIVDPVIGTPTPASGTIARTDSVSIPISDNVELGQITCWVTYASAPDVELIYDGAAFSSLFDDYSSISGTIASKTLVVRRDNPGWLDSPTIHLRVTDAAGNEVTDSFPYTVSGYPFLPALSNVSPVNGSSIARTAPISFDVSDDVSLSLVTVHVSYPSAPEADVAYTGAAFAPRFDAASSVTPITGGSSFVIQPDGNGWRDDPTITIRATDPDGNPLGAVISYTLSGASYPFAPTIQNLTPSDGDVTPDEYVSFDVFSDNDLAACVVLARFPDLVIDAENSISMYEVVWDGTQLGDMYKTYSTSSPIIKGRHFSLRRFGGWPVGVTFKTVSVNTEGQAG